MQPAALYCTDPASARFVGGGLGDAEALLGAPLPPLPVPETDHGRPMLYVRFQPGLRTQLHRFLQDLLAQIGIEAPGAPARTPDAGAREAAEYEASLERALCAVRAADRRIGLANLFWLAHTQQVSETLAEMETRLPAIRKTKHALHPLLSSFYRRVDQAARRAVEQSQPGRVAFLTGGRESGSLVDALIDDGFALTETRASDLDLSRFLSANKRYRISADVFFEFCSILSSEVDRRLRESDRGLLSRVARHLPGLPRDHYTTAAGLTKIAFNGHVLTYLLADPWGTGSKLLASPRLKAEAEKRRPSEIVDAFLDFVAGVKRFEIVSHLRSHVHIVRAGAAEEERVRAMRVYEFGDSAQVLNNAVNATVLFLDLRGFTQTSEGQISARDLTQELYAVFDAFVPHIRRFGGVVDKFLGDGIMVTFGTRGADPLSPLNGLRAAVLCQEELIRLRRQGRTEFRMGVSVHYGRVYVARFIADDEAVQVTVIGRNVNLAGRLSSAAKKPMDEDDSTDPGLAPISVRDLQVTVDASGALLNEGIAISREALQQLEEQLSLERAESGDSSIIDYRDEAIGRRLLIRYAGDAKFKGIRSSVPVYEVDFVR
jgi:class 3 adenylate cyclase